MNERAVHLTIGSFACLMLMAIVLSVRLSTVQPPYGTQVYGSSHVWRGHTASFRVVLTDPDGYTALVPAELALSLRDERGVRLRYDAKPRERAELSTITLAVPSDLQSYASLDVDVRRPEGSDHMTVPLRADTQPPVPAGRVAPWGELQPTPPPPPALNNPWRVAAYPDNGQLVGGLPNGLTLRITHGGTPVAALVECPALHLHEAADPAGLLHVVYRPAPKGDALRVVLNGDDKNPVNLNLEAKPTQLTVAVDGNTVVSPGTTPAVSVSTLPFRGTLHADLWVGNALVASNQGEPVHGLWRTALPVPQDAAGLVRWTVYRNLARPEDTASHVVRWVATDGNTRAVLPLLKSLSGSDPTLDALADPNAVPAILALALSRFVPESPGPLLLASTGESRRTVFETAKEGERGRIHRFLAGVMGVGFAMACVLLLRHHRRTKRDVGAVMRAAEAAGEAVDASQASRVSTPEQGYLLLLALIALAMAGYGLFELLSKMRWDR